MKPVILSTLPASTTPLTIETIGAVDIGAHPFTLDLRTAVGLTETQARTNDELASLIRLGLITLTFGTELFDDTNIDDIEEIIATNNRFKEVYARNDLVVTSSTSTTYQDIDFVATVGGVYMLRAYVTYRFTSTSRNCRFTIEANGVNVVNPSSGGWAVVEPKDGGTDIRTPLTVIGLITVNEGDTINVKFKGGREDNSGSLYIYNSILSIQEF